MINGQDSLTVYIETHFQIYILDLLFTMYFIFRSWLVTETQDVAAEISVQLHFSKPGPLLEKSRPDQCSGGGANPGSELS